MPEGDRGAPGRHELKGIKALIRVGAPGEARYAVDVGPGRLARLVRATASGAFLPGQAAPSSVAIVADRRVGVLYGARLVRAFSRRGIRAFEVRFPAGEPNKTRETKSRIEDALARERFGRDGLIVALGGGVTGDLAGFVAATWHRGVSYVHAPTTTLAMLDASIGGKVGVDHPAAKNLIGAFHAPRAVFADTGLLRTLSDRDYRSGWAEAVKLGVILDPSLLEGLTRRAAALRARRPHAAIWAIRRTAALKARIVSGDPRESGSREILNFGHTVGHALEAASRYRMRHGEAVALGITAELRIAEALGLVPRSNAASVERLLAALGLPIRLARHMPTRAILDAMAQDKKARRGQVRFVLPELRAGRLGVKARVGPVSDAIVRAAIEGLFSGSGARSRG